MLRFLHLASLAPLASLALVVACSDGSSRQPLRPLPVQYGPPSPAQAPAAGQPHSPTPTAPTAATTAPTAAPAPKPAPPQPSRDPWRANQDPSDDRVVGPPEAFGDCEQRLRAAGVKFRAATIPVKPAPGSSDPNHVCGAPQIVLYEGGPTSARWSTPFKATCGLAIALARFEQVAQEEAARHLNTKVKSIKIGGTYSCRHMQRFSLVSEHSYANAIDVYGFSLENGKAVSVVAHFGPAKQELSASAPAEARFLRAFASRLYDEGAFSVVLTPHFDRLHRDHLHLDMARYRMDGTRP